MKSRLLVKRTSWKTVIACKIVELVEQRNKIKLISVGDVKSDQNFSYKKHLLTQFHQQIQRAVFEENPEKFKMNFTVLCLTLSIVLMSFVNLTSCKPQNNDQQSSSSSQQQSSGPNGSQSSSSQFSSQGSSQQGSSSSSSQSKTSSTSNNGRK